MEKIENELSFYNYDLGDNLFLTAVKPRLFRIIADQLNLSIAVGPLTPRILTFEFLDAFKNLT